MSRERHHHEEAEYRYQRQLQLPTEIVELSRNNVLVHHVIEQFVAGRIITPTECLAQCVVNLARNWEEAQRRACDDMLKHAQFTVTRENP